MSLSSNLWAGNGIADRVSEQKKGPFTFIAASPVARTPLASSRASSNGRKRAAITPPLLTLPPPVPFGTPPPPPAASKGERNASRDAREEEGRNFCRAIPFPSPCPPPALARGPGVPGNPVEAPPSVRLADNRTPVGGELGSLRPERRRSLIPPPFLTPKPPLIPLPFLTPKPLLFALVKPSANLSSLPPSPPHARWRDVVRSDSMEGDRRAGQRSEFIGDVEKRPKKTLCGGGGEERKAGKTRGGDGTKASAVWCSSRRR